jgi:5S rRNA maturation endonuclease (ribonuclease M5)
MKTEKWTLNILPEFTHSTIELLKQEHRWTPKAFLHFGIKEAILTNNKTKAQDTVIVFKTANYTKVYLLHRKSNKWMFLEAGGSLLGDLTSQQIILCEGEWDLLSLYEIGCTNVVTSNTGCSSASMELFNDLKNKEVVVLYDADDAGKRGAEKAIQTLLDLECKVSYVDLTTHCEENEKDIRDIIVRTNKDKSIINCILESAISIKPLQEVELSLDKDEIFYPLVNAPKFVNMFSEIFKDSTEAPEVFLHAVGLSVLSAVSSNLIKANGTFVNDYFLLIGSSGLTKKSTAMDYGIDLLNHIKSLDRHNKIIIEEIEYPLMEIISAATQEGIESALAVPGRQVTIQYDEYKRLFDNSKKQGQDHLISFLTTIYSQKYYKNRLREKTFECRNYGFTCLAGSTKKWLSEFMTNSNIGGGFVNRHLVVMSPPTDNDIPIRPNISEMKIFELAKDIYERRPLEIINMSFDEIGERAYIEYYKEAKKEMRQADEDTCDIMARETDHVVKIAALKAYYDGLNAIDAESIFYGIGWAKASTKAILQLNKDNSLKLTVDERKVLAFVKKRVLQEARPVTKSDIGGHFGGKQDVYKRAIERLISLGLLKRKEKGICPNPNSVEAKH